MLSRYPFTAFLHCDTEFAQSHTQIFKTVPAQKLKVLMRPTTVVQRTAIFGCSTSQLGGDNDIQYNTWYLCYLVCSILCWNDWWHDQHTCPRLTKVRTRQRWWCKYQESHNNWSINTKGSMHPDRATLTGTHHNIHSRFQNTKKMGVDHFFKFLSVFLINVWDSHLGPIPLNPVNLDFRSQGKIRKKKNQNYQGFWTNKFQ